MSRYSVDVFVHVIWAMAVVPLRGRHIGSIARGAVSREGGDIRVVNRQNIVTDFAYDMAGLSRALELLRIHLEASSLPKAADIKLPVTLPEDDVGPNEALERVAQAFMAGAARLSQPKALPALAFSGRVGTRLQHFFASLPTATLAALTGTLVVSPHEGRLNAGGVGALIGIGIVASWRILGLIRRRRVAP